MQPFFSSLNEMFVLKNLFLISRSEDDENRIYCAQSGQSLGSSGPGIRLVEMAHLFNCPSTKTVHLANLTLVIYTFALIIA